MDKVCPFCLGNASDTARNGHNMKWYIKCHLCQAQGPSVDTEGEARSSWNSRQAPADAILSARAEILGHAV